MAQRSGKEVQGRPTLNDQGGSGAHKSRGPTGPAGRRQPEIWRAPDSEKRGGAGFAGPVRKKKRAAASGAQRERQGRRARTRAAAATLGAREGGEMRRTPGTGPRHLRLLRVRRARSRQAGTARGPGGRGESCTPRTLARGQALGAGRPISSAAPCRQMWGVEKMRRELRARCRARKICHAGRPRENPMKFSTPDADPHKFCCMKIFARRCPHTFFRMTIFARRCPHNFFRMDFFARR